MSRDRRGHRRHRGSRGTGLRTRLPGEADELGAAVINARAATQAAGVTHRAADAP